MDYNFLEVLGIWWHGRWQAVLLAIPLIKPGREGNKAPAWFRAWYKPWVWSAYLDSDDRPTEQWLVYYDEAAKRLFQSWLEDLRGRAVSDAGAWVWSWTGGPRHGYPTLADWLEAVWTSVRSTLPTFISNLAAIVAALPTNLRDWVQSEYDAAKAKVATLWTWLQGRGSLLSALYDDVGVWIADFKQNPAGVILGILGDTWEKLVTFDQGALGYFYDLWGTYRQTLADFLADPLGWIYDQAEDFLVSKW